MRSENPIHRGGHLVELASMRLRRVPEIARHAALGHMNDYDLENQSRA